MFTMNTYTDRGMKMVKLENNALQSKLLLSLTRGGMITELTIKNESLLYMDNDSFYDMSKSIRGGIPILFPICGALTNKQYRWNNHTYAMNNHGFARDMEWVVERTELTEDYAEIDVSLTSTQETLDAFPFAFTILFTYTLNASSLMIKQQFINDSEDEMPISAGFHPYFKGNHKKINYTIPSTKRFDYHDRQWKDKSGFPTEVSLHEAQVFTELKENVVIFQNENHSSIQLTFSPEYKYIAVWTEKEEEYVCIEPWMGLMDEINTNRNITTISPKSALETNFTIEML
ncbi:hypothetical protein [Bacillus sp. B1-b2]|uniref:aldose epimerase family protein n=1 Tax=Bacillus sp. B1-b2 TaxID=2653201 RepID=UPI0012614171|nr:hypothetical protein [Bacillus sp. B1-b2]KAB7668426.1 hypothetical protein F9279_13495 [Bacillus sp. B1-b2]